MKQVLIYNLKADDITTSAKLLIGFYQLLNEANIYLLNRGYENMKLIDVTFSFNEKMHRATIQIDSKIYDMYKIQTMGNAPKKQMAGVFFNAFKKYEQQ